MPKRIVDGEALWGSRKLKNVEPRYQLHYANWIPMAAANGVFEADPDTILSKVYSFLAPAYPITEVEKILAEFKRVGLVRTWEAGGKTWGYFVGIEKQGRLPPPSQRGRYGELPPNPPVNHPDIKPDMVAGYCAQYNQDPNPSSEPQSIQEDGVRASKQIPVLSLQILGVKAEPWESVWAEIKTLTLAFGDSQVVDAFEDWANTNKGETFNDKPVSEFLKVAAGLLTGTIAATQNPALAALLDEMVYLTKGEVTFDSQQARGVGKLLSSYTAEEVLSAFRTFWNRIEGDAFLVKMAAKKFPEQAEQLINFDRRNKLESAQQQKLVDETRENLRASTDAEIAALNDAKSAEKDLIEEAL